MKTIIVGMRKGEPMSDLTSRQAVKEWLARWEGYIDTDIIARMQCRVVDIPSAEPEIIHCRDCENWDTTWTNFQPNYHYCSMVDGARRDDFYCADAERRTDG